MTAERVIESLALERASAIVRASSQEVAAGAMEAAVRAGFRIIEFTMTTPGALELVSEFGRRSDLIVGAGTVIGCEDAVRAIAAGADFLVSPVVEDEVIAVAADRDVAVIPGAHTPTEMLRAHRAGAPLIKLFPAPAGGPLWLRSVLGPLPFLRIVPTHGVDADNVGEWLAAGAFGVGFAAALFDPADLKNRDYDAIEQRARRILEAVRQRPAGHR